jgi:hypothetical protein
LTYGDSALVAALLSMVRRIEHLNGDIQMDKINPLFTATATTIGGRNGHTESNDGLVKADLSVPKAMGGQISPEQQRPSTY